MGTQDNLLEGDRSNCPFKLYMVLIFVKSDYLSQPWAELLVNFLNKISLRKIKENENSTDKKILKKKEKKTHTHTHTHTQQQHPALPVNWLCRYDWSVSMILSWYEMEDFSKSNKIFFQNAKFWMVWHCGTGLFTLNTEQTCFSIIWKCLTQSKLKEGNQLRWLFKTGKWSYMVHGEGHFRHNKDYTHGSSLG